MRKEIIDVNLSQREDSEYAVYDKLNVYQGNRNTVFRLYIDDYVDASSTPDIIHIEIYVVNYSRLDFKKTVRSVDQSMSHKRDNPSTLLITQFGIDDNRKVYFHLSTEMYSMVVDTPYKTEVIVKINDIFYRPFTYYVNPNPAFNSFNN